MVLNTRNQAPKEAVCGPLRLLFCMQVVCGRRKNISLNGEFHFKRQAKESKKIAKGKGEKMEHVGDSNTRRKTEHILFLTIKHRVSIRALNRCGAVMSTTRAYPTRKAFTTNLNCSNQFFVPAHRMRMVGPTAAEGPQQAHLKIG